MGFGSAFFALVVNFEENSSTGTDLLKWFVSEKKLKTIYTCSIPLGICFCFLILLKWAQDNKRLKAN